MIKYTNSHNLPLPLFKALISSDYDEHDSFVSVTSLIDSPYIWKMKQYAGGNSPSVIIHEDASTRLWAMLGNAVHSLVDKAGSEYITEFRARAIVNEKILSGKADLYDPYKGTISDYKITSKYKACKPVIEWERQLNVLAFLFRNLGFQVAHLEIIAILRDFMYKDKFDGQFPNIPMKIVPIKLWSNAEQEQYISNRIDLFTKYHNTPINELEPCSKEERWANDIVYACKAKDAKKSTKNFSNALEAQAFAEAKGLMIELREARDTRCLEYCSLKSICSYARSKDYDKVQSKY